MWTLRFSVQLAKPAMKAQFVPPITVILANSPCDTLKRPLRAFAISSIFEISAGRIFRHPRTGLDKSGQLSMRWKKLLRIAVKVPELVQDPGSGMLVVYLTQRRAKSDAIDA
ncbi:MAG: hypothetical protein Q9198_005427 [Flavoplaca austrocitrina]